MNRKRNITVVVFAISFPSEVQPDTKDKETEYDAAA